MNTICKMVALASLCLGTTATTYAQTADTAHNAVSELQKKWFGPDKEEQRYDFTISLSKGESMVIKFKRLSDWTSQGDFLNALSDADKVMAAYKDSLLQEQNT